jgi:hypothetical protein
MKVVMHTRSNKFGLNGIHLVLKEITGSRVTVIVPEALLPETERFGSETRPVDFEVSELKAVIGTISVEVEAVTKLPEAQNVAPAPTPLEVAIEESKAEGNAADQDEAGTEPVAPVAIGKKTGK